MGRAGPSYDLLFVIRTRLRKPIQVCLDLRTPAVSPSTAFEPPLLKRDGVELAKVVVAAALSADAAAAPRCGAFFCRLGA